MSASPTHACALLLLGLVILAQPPAASGAGGVVLAQGTGTLTTGTTDCVGVFVDATIEAVVVDGRLASIAVVSVVGTLVGTGDSVAYAQPLDVVLAPSASCARAVLPVTSFQLDCGTGALAFAAQDGMLVSVAASDVSCVPGAAA